VLIPTNWSFFGAGAFSWIFVLRLLFMDFDILIARHNRAALGGFTVGGRDLHQLRFGGDCFPNMGI
jgi:hypothetical protein